MVEDAAALTGDPVPDVSRRAVLVLCADNGVVAQGVSQTDAYVTRAVLENLTARRTSVCRMAAAAHCDVVPVDMGIAGAPVPGAADCRIAAGTADFTTGPAMTRAQAVQAIAAADMLIIGGTSLNVWPAAGLINYFRGEHLVLINKSAVARDLTADLVITDPIGEVLDQL